VLLYPSVINMSNKQCYIMSGYKISELYKCCAGNTYCKQITYKRNTNSLWVKITTLFLGNGVGQELHANVFSEKFTRI